MGWRDGEKMQTIVTEFKKKSIIPFFSMPKARIFRHSCMAFKLQAGQRIINTRF